MHTFEKHSTRNGFTMKLWRGERMCLLGFDVERPEQDFVGFAIEVKAPGQNKFVPLYNRLAFSYDTTAGETVDGSRNFPSTTAPLYPSGWGRSGSVARIHRDGVSAATRRACERSHNDAPCVRATS